ncbi:winged helix-turn-helix transcriptional regulator [Xanthobacter dioxanivorans]|uniref:Winged helix-turn-helix transcriptional regulator n=1 Tax=Xanthobacter dioxanivorans TaxID=2528964 RepID=A0A974PS71_9HYPH|nr:MarR family winged helix-turn-helix transcriptional regulator [Xanthobacter dioxanivorans]QRG08389.1 winged helix-turn-helix transcriptional regulator [Xanthobacter dioxanivorans]
MLRHKTEEFNNITPPSPDVCDGSSVTDTFGYLIRRIQDQSVRTFSEFFSEYQLNPIGYAILSVTARNPGVRQGMLASVLGVQESNMANAIKDLMNRQLLARVRRKKDGKAYYGLELSQGGLAIIDDLTRRATELEHRQLINLTQKERDQFMILLKKIARL